MLEKSHKIEQSQTNTLRVDYEKRQGLPTEPPPHPRRNMVYIYLITSPKLVLIKIQRS